MGKTYVGNGNKYIQWKSKNKEILTENFISNNTLFYT